MSLLVNIRENIHFFFKKVLQKFCHYIESSYLCTRFHRHGGVSEQKRESSLKGLHRQFSSTRSACLFCQIET